MKTVILLAITLTGLLGQNSERLKFYNETATTGLATIKPVLIQFWDQHKDPGPVVSMTADGQVILGKGITPEYAIGRILKYYAHQKCELVPTGIFEPSPVVQ